MLFEVKYKHFISFKFSLLKFLSLDWLTKAIVLSFWNVFEANLLATWKKNNKCRTFKEPECSDMEQNITSIIMTFLKTEKINISKKEWIWQNWLFQTFLKILIHKNSFKRRFVCVKYMVKWSLFLKVHPQNDRLLFHTNKYVS